MKADVRPENKRTLFPEQKEGRAVDTLIISKSLAAVRSGCCSQTARESKTAASVHCFAPYCRYWDIHPAVKYFFFLLFFVYICHYLT